MKLIDQDIITANVVVVLGAPGKATLPLTALQSLLSPPVNVSQTVDGSLIVTSQKDQIEIQILTSAMRVIVTDNSGMVPGKSKIAGLLYKTLKLIPDASTKAYGYNFDLTFRLKGAPVPSEFLQTNILTLGRKSKFDISTIEEVSLSLVYTRRKAKIALTVEPYKRQPSTTFFASANIHYQKPLKLQAKSVQNDISRRYTQLLDEIVSVLGGEHD